ncbi:MAG: cobyric acid synthase [Pseudomonadota bacterium]
MAKAIMFQGTGSDVGKTVLVAGLCRALTNRGLTVRPFKPQNMSNNAAVAEDGGEIGRAQWLQALACRCPTSVHMNPVLLKPQSETGSQIVVHGKVRGAARGREYQALKGTFMTSVMESFEIMKSQADIVVVEGAGSPAEINLRKGDIANMGFATEANVPVILVGDIDRGGVIASLVGTHTILTERDRKQIEGFLINKFRGDVSLFDDGLKAVTDFTGWPSLGVVPWLTSVSKLPAEDSVALEQLSRAKPSGKIKIAVPVMSRIANFDDLDPLMNEPELSLQLVREGDSFPVDADAVILVGSKSTISDMAQMRAFGWDRMIIDLANRGRPIVGICGGYQMLGKMISDPEGLEGQKTSVKGLRLLDVSTVMAREKITRNDLARTVSGDHEITGYQIHLGETSGPDTARPFARVDGTNDGAMNERGNIFGTYLHGLFGSGDFRKTWLKSLGVESSGRDQIDIVDRALDDLAAEIETYIDVEKVLSVAR